MNATWFRRAIGATALLGLTTLITTPGWADALDTIMQRKKILVAIDLGNPPHGMMDAAFKPTGSDVETAQNLAKDLGVELEIVQVTAPNRVQYLLANKADVVISALSITDERKKVIDFTRPYAELQCVVAAPKSMAISSYADLSGKGVSVTRGTVNDQELTRGTANVPNVQIVRFDDDPTSVTGITSGQLQVFASSLPLINQLKKDNPNVDLETKFVMKGFPLGIAFRKNEPKLAAKLNDWVSANLKNGKLVEIYNRYHGVKIDPEKLAGM
ncbi:transporter substrate-binding domain-containing protein [Microvirga lotononidis]|uniref:Periplasmic component of amino acid ABC-type transporter/signal transduction system n=1 Tax=Microvirga lotononidis TaxID=864069 RepID=I4Z130_9HYPH|nr:transporter substrate-binding domain-containing protein [Microvirga lotononidis]EIM29922.1 periplasmic component of amino acid ABC-type transporter/signal transduction system [Microvirga lotononidis]WQO31001.1 transporter substrate-binding domain-containing protein [Microvirga lotononidis]